MVSAGSAVPNNGDTCDFLGACAPRTRRRFAAVAPLVLLPLLLQGCGNSEPKTLAKADAAMLLSGYSTHDMNTTSIVRADAQFGPADSFADRYAPTDEYPLKPVPPMVVERVATPSPASYKLASLSPDLPFALPAIKQEQTHLIGFENSAFPYPGKSYTDNRVLVHVPAGFDVRKPGVIVVFYHGHGATLSRDIRDRQLVPKQITESGINAVLVAPQLAYDAADSSAGKFYEKGGFKRFMGEAAEHLARIYGDARAAQAFAKMPVIIVAYSGGFVSAANSLHVGGLGKRVRGVVLLDALYGEIDKFSTWIAKNRSGFFVSAYTAYTKHHDDDLAKILRDKGIAVTDELNGYLKPGTVAFLQTPDSARHRDYVTLAWTEHPVTDILQRIPRRQ
jgi:hypothetical protein